MAYTFGTRIEDVPKDSFGNFLIDERLTLYPTREDAVAQTNPLGTATTGKDGYWSFAHTDGLVWVRQSTGEIRSLFAPESLSSTLVARVEPASYTYNTDGTVASETAGGKTTTYTYNPDGSVKTVSRDGVTLTYTYNTDGTVAGVA